jgi:hypothetical protein
MGLVETIQLLLRKIYVAGRLEEPSHGFDYLKLKLND